MKILVYVGPSLDLITAQTLLPDATFLPPVRHADIISHIHKYSPTHILVIDGVFDKELPEWHKAFSYAALCGIKIFGCSSMGALRAAELADAGVMIGTGNIFHWFWEGVTDDDSEVALVYHQNTKGEYVLDTCPLVNIRAGLLEDGDEEEFEKQRSIHYSQRFVTPPYAIDQKRIDAIDLLVNFRSYDYSTEVRPDLSYLTPMFHAMLDRELRVEHNGAVVTLQNLDSYITLHSPDENQICWDSKNRGLALILSDILQITVTPEEIEYEWVSFCARWHLETWDSFQEWLKDNAMCQSNFDVLTIQNAKIRKLHKAYITKTMFSRQTRAILDYLRTHNRLSGYLDDCADIERKIVDSNNEDSVDIDFSHDLKSLLAEHFEETGLEISGTLDNFLRETGIGSREELRVCLERYALARRTKVK